MYILGIGDQTHDPSVCIAKNGKIIAAIEAERLTRLRHNLNVDTRHYQINKMGKYFADLCQELTLVDREKVHNQCIDYCLNAAGKIHKSEIKTTVLSTLFESPAFPYESVCINHHLAHAASAFFASPFLDAAILTLDGYGNPIGDRFETGSWGIGKESSLTVLGSYQGDFEITKEERLSGVQNTIITLNNSIGALYKNITVLIGMGHYGEGKTMGLAAYGEDNPLLAPIRDYITLLPHGEFQIENRSLYEWCKNKLEQLTITLPPEKCVKLKADLAFKVQQISEEIVIHCCQHLYRETKRKKLCFAGGVALNSVINGKILEKTPFKEIFVQPAAGDNGVALGCAYYGSYVLSSLVRTPRVLTGFNPYLGKIYEINAIENEIKHYKNELVALPTDGNLYRMLAKLIAKGKVIGLFNDSSEFGPRALGNRSIVADPRDVRMKDYLNLQIKKREAFRPFAPAVLEEAASDYFHSDYPSPYMLRVVSVREEMKTRIPAVTHQDGTARLQTVNKKQNPNFYKLLKAFERVTNIPILLNTSFNGKNEPIVETPKDAIRCFIRLKLDVLFINGKLLTRPSIASEIRMIAR